MKPVRIVGKTDYIVDSEAVGRSTQVDETGVELWRSYICKDEIGTEYLLKIASDKKHNGVLSREVFLLSDVDEEIARVNTEYKKRNHTNSGLGFQRCMPKLFDSFIAVSEQDKQVNVIAFYGTKQISDLVPLSQWRTRGVKTGAGLVPVRIDPKSSAWIMGRLLKIFTLTHPFGLANGLVTGENIVVNPSEHHVVLFDWTRARHNGGQLPVEMRSAEISAAAKAVIEALGGNPLTGVLPLDDQLIDSRYADLLFRFALGLEADVFAAGRQFYELIDQLWEKSFHPFTTIPLNS